jgi:hypothetical protein
VTYTDDLSAQTSCWCVLTQQHEPVLVQGELRIMEDHYSALLPVSALDRTPAIGDGIETADGTHYAVDVAPEQVEGMWRLLVRAQA